MNEREELVKADMLIFRSLASLDVSIHDVAMANMGLHDVVISQRRQAQILQQIYEGIVELAQRLGDAWEEALLLTRTTALQGSGDMNTQYAYEKFIRQTNHLFNL